MDGEPAQATLLLGAAVTQPARLAQALERAQALLGSEPASPRAAAWRSGMLHAPVLHQLGLCEEGGGIPSASTEQAAIQALARDIQAWRPSGHCENSPPQELHPPRVLLLALPPTAWALGADPLPLLQDQRLRGALDTLRWPYRLLHGEGQVLLRAALEAMDWAPSRPAAHPTAGPAAPAPPDGSMAAKRLRLRALGCEKCSDPVCEHRLFTGLSG